MLQDRHSKAAIMLLLASSAAAIAVLSTSELLAEGVVGGGWDYRSAVVTALPYALIWGFTGGGMAFILCRRARPRSVRSEVVVSGAGGAALAAMSLVALDTPGGGGLLEIVAVLLAGSIWGVVVGWLGWRVSGLTTDSTATHT